VALAVLVFDALLRCYLKLLLLLHQVSCCLFALASLASCAGAKLPHCTFIFRWRRSSSVCCLPSKCCGSWIMAQVSGTLVCALHRVNELKLIVETAMELSMYMSCSTSGSIWPATSSCFPGKILVRTCKHVFIY
jgi:hypothetical protein